MVNSGKSRGLRGREADPVRQRLLDACSPQGTGIHSEWRSITCWKGGGLWKLRQGQKAMEWRRLIPGTLGGIPRSELLLGSLGADLGS